MSRPGTAIARSVMARIVDVIEFEKRFGVIKPEAASA